jgi:Arc/MetJ-type ribon-helix-helix transcriptional regulator/plasmid stabilization system protein ParE
MAIVLSPEVEQQIEELVKSGRFASADECVRTCVGFFKYHEEDQRKILAEMQAAGHKVRRLVTEGGAALGRGDYFDYDDEALAALLDRIKREERPAGAGDKPVAGRYRLTSPARDDLRDIWKAVSYRSAGRADRFLDELHARFQEIVERPSAPGTKDIVYGTECRIHRAAEFFIFYRPAADRVEVVRILEHDDDLVFW